MFLLHTLLTLTLLPHLALTAPPPLKPSIQIPRPFIYTHAPYTINYTSTTLHHQPGTTTTTHNFLTALEQALTHLQSLRTQAHALPSDPIPGNSFTFQVQLDRQAPQYRRSPRSIRFTMQGRFTLMLALALKYQEVGVALRGLLAYAEAERGQVTMCGWTVAELGPYADVWVARGRVDLIPYIAGERRGDGGILKFW